jgi:hypothetical protein
MTLLLRHVAGRVDVGLSLRLQYAASIEICGREN